MRKGDGGHVTMKRFAHELIRQLDHDDAFGLAAQCAYYFLFSLFPFALFVISLLGYLPIASGDLLSLAQQYVPGEVFRQLEQTLGALIRARHGGTLSLGLIVTLVTASAAMNAIVLAVNKAYGLPKRKSFIHSRVLAIVLTLGLLLVVASALLLSVFGQVIVNWLQTYTAIPWDKIELWNIWRLLINFAILLIVFTGIYYVAPNTCLTCKDVLPGAIVAAVGWQLSSLGFSYYVNHWGNFNATYGSLGGVIVLMTWFYISALLIIVGGEINAINYNMKHSPAKR